MKRFVTVLSCLILSGCVTSSEDLEVLVPEVVISPVAPQSVCQAFDDFSGEQKIDWQRVNDNVMGGRSIGGFEFEDNTMVLRGSINLNGGGFTSVRAPLPTQALAPFDFVVVTAKSDGRGYQLTFRDRNQRRLSHRLALNLEASEDFQETTIQFSDLEPAFFGRTVRAAPFNKTQAREIGIILNDGLGGDYQLEVKEIKFCQTV